MRDYRNRSIYGRDIETELRIDSRGEETRAQPLYQWTRFCLFERLTPVIVERVDRHECLLERCQIVAQLFDLSIGIEHCPLSGVNFWNRVVRLRQLSRCAGHLKDWRSLPSIEPSESITSRSSVSSCRVSRRRDAPWPGRSPRALPHPHIRIWVGKYEAGAFDENVEAETRQRCSSPPPTAITTNRSSRTAPRIARSMPRTSSGPPT